MKRSHSMKRSNILMFCLIILTVPKFCFAYIDPATGSLVIQMAIGFAVAGLFIIKRFWYNIIHSIKGFFGKNTDESDSEE